MISVVVPVYNAEKYLVSCVESILRQDFTDFELLLIDDGSRDASGEICDRFAEQDPRVRCFHRENAGVGATRNFGIDRAQGDWICFIDSDDEVLPNYLSAFHTDNTRADIVITGIDFLNTASGELIRREQYQHTVIDMDSDPRGLIKYLSVGFPYGKAYRKNFFKNGLLRFPSDISFHEDHVFVFDCFLQSKIIEIRPEVTYIYRIDYGNQSLSKKKHPWEKHWTASQYMFDRIFKIRDTFGYNDDELREIYTFAYEPVIAAVYDVYDGDFSRRERTGLLRRLLKEKLPIGRYYYPASKRGKLVKLAAAVSPLGVLDLFFLAVNRYQNRRK